MRRFFIGLSFIFCMLALPATAQMNFAEMTEQEKTEFGEAVRAYLMENPRVLMEVIQRLEENQAAAEAAMDGDIIAAYSDYIFNDGFSFVGGNPDGKVLMVEFIDYKCGYCKRVHQDVRELVKNNPDIRFVLKEFPILGDESMEASRAALAVLTEQGDEIYDRFQDRLMQFNGTITENSLRSIAESVGADAESMFEAMDGQLIDEIIATNRQLAQILKITGTPGFVFNDRIQRGAGSYAAMQQVVDEILDGLN